MFLPKNYIRRVSNNNITEINETFKKHIIECFETIFEDKPMFNKSNFKFYYYDEYVLNTSTFLSPYATLYVEINQPENYKQTINEKAKTRKQKVVAPNLHLKLKDIKQTLIDCSVNTFDENTLIWQDKHAVNYAYNLYDENNEKSTYYFRVIPCLTYKNENNVNGVIYYNDTEGDIEIEYPKLSLLNFKHKDKETNGLFSDYIVMFKNIFMKEKNESALPFEIFEILLYNVPNQLFIDYSNNSILKVINYLRNFNIKNFVTLDNQAMAFTTPYRSLSIIYVGHVLKKISNFLKKQQN